MMWNVAYPGYGEGEAGVTAGLIDAAARIHQRGDPGEAVRESFRRCLTACLEKASGDLGDCFPAQGAQLLRKASGSGPLARRDISLACLAVADVLYAKYPALHRRLACNDTYAGRIALDEVEARAAAAPDVYWHPPGSQCRFEIPWVISEDELDSRHGWDHWGRYLVLKDGDWDGSAEPLAALWAFLGRARDDVLILSREIRRLRAELGTAREAAYYSSRLAAGRGSMTLGELGEALASAGLVAGTGLPVQLRIGARAYPLAKAEASGYRSISAIILCAGDPDD